MVVQLKSKTQCIIKQYQGIWGTGIIAFIVSFQEGCLAIHSSTIPGLIEIGLTFVRELRGTMQVGQPTGIPGNTRDKDTLIV